MQQGDCKKTINTLSGEERPNTVLPITLNQPAILYDPVVYKDVVWKHHALRT